MTILISAMERMIIPLLMMEIFMAWPATEDSTNLLQKVYGFTGPAPV